MKNKMIISRHVLFIILFLAPFYLQAQDQLAAVKGLIHRLLPEHEEAFEAQLIPKTDEKDVFELEMKDNKIVLRGTNGVALASALYHYLKTYGHCDVSWNGSNLKLPKILAPVEGKIRKKTPYTYRYYLNYCTFNYSMSWWNWERWEREIDWMALHGINFPLAITGQNSIWYRVYQSFGLTSQDLQGFFSGPAYFNWFWMGNLDGWGGPLPISLMQKQEALQKKILERERSFGMKPILPAFTGHVPKAFKEKFPQAILKETKWSTFPAVTILDPADPLFTQVGKRFLEEEIKTFGTDHFYTSDTFNENAPPTNDSTFLSEVSKKVYQSMALADPKATWIMQGWLFHFHAKFWQPTQIKALLNAVPNDRLLVLDLWSENHPVWNRTEAYYGKPWIWCMLHNFGGNISLYGRMDEVAKAPANALHDPKAGQLVGIGLTPEAIEQNPVIYALMLDNVWTDQAITVDRWLSDYVRRRYGSENSEADQAWKILHTTVYTGGILNGGPESIITGRPTLNKNSGGTRTERNYQDTDLIPAWTLFINASAALSNSEGFKYDLVDLSRQVLANYADTLQRSFSRAYKKQQWAIFEQQANAFLDVMDDLDNLLGTQKDFLLGKWLEDAKALGDDDQEKRLYEKNARNLITLWGDRNASLHEYSNRQWSGLLKGFYKARWLQFFAYIKHCHQQQETPDWEIFEEHMKDWEWQWVNSHETYPAGPQGNPVPIAQALYKKYMPLFHKTYHLK